MIKRFIKKYLALFLSGAAMLTFSAASLCPIRKASAAPQTTYSNSGGVIKLENSLIELKWDSTNGAITGLRNKQTGTQYLGGTAFSNWTVFINTRTGSMWQADLGDIMAKGKDAASVNVLATNISNGIKLSFTYSNVAGKNINITYHVTVYDNDPVSRWTADITNNEPGTTVTAFIFPQLSGIQTLADEKLAWPYREGRIYENPGADLKFIAYPMPASMQWMDLYNQNESLYYAVLDDKAHFKEFRFGYDGNILPSAENPRLMAATLWPYTEPNTTYSSPVVEIGLGSEGNWYWGADRYREFINNAWVPQKHVSQAAYELGAINSVLLKNGDILYNDYAALPGIIDGKHVYGMHNLWIFGWHKGGFDALYPDYEFLPEIGGGNAFQTAISQLHQNGDKATIYLNGFCADTKSNWFLQHGDTQSIRGVHGNYYSIPLPHDVVGRYICPKSAAFQEQLKNRMMDLRSKGIDHVFFDQVMELDALQCFNPDHGHSSPAAAFAEGLEQMFGKLHTAFSYNGSQNDYFFMAEGVHDYLSTFINIGIPAGYRLDEYKSLLTPGIARYTIPVQILGQPTGENKTTAIDIDGVKIGTEIFEAEDGILLGSGVVYNDNAASAGKKVGSLHNMGSGVQIDNLPQTSNIRIRYSRGMAGSCIYKLYVNDIYVQDVLFDTTGTWTGPYMEKAVNINIPSNGSLKIVNEDPKGVLDEYAKAFTMGMPFWDVSGPGASPNPYVFDRYLKIYEKEPDIYYYGTYKDERGLVLDNPNVKATLIVGKNNDRIGVQFRNPTSFTQIATITIDYGKIGLAGKKIASITDLENSQVIYEEGVNALAFTVTIPAYDVKAYKVSFGNPVRFEAEHGSIIGGALVLDDPAASNGKKVGCIEVSGRGVQFTGLPQSYGINIAYSRGWSGPCVYKLYVNDVYIKDIVFIQTRGWDGAYLSCCVPVDIPAGAVVRIMNESGGNTAIDIDYISSISGQ